MPRIPSNYLECVFYVYPTRKDAETREKVGGTGFFVAVPLENSSLLRLFAVTNSHVAGRGRAIRVNSSGGTEVIDVELGAWTHHPDGDDLAAVEIGEPAPLLRFVALTPSLFVTDEKIAELNVGPGDDTFSIGRLITIDGRQENSPMVRFGSIAMMPDKPIRQQLRSFDQLSYLVESRSLSGFSGSPVFLHIPPFSYRFRTGNFEDNEGISPTTHLMLLGVVWGSIKVGDEVIQGINSGVMAVVPASKLASLLSAL